MLLNTFFLVLASSYVTFASLIEDCPADRFKHNCACYKSSTFSKGVSLYCGYTKSQKAFEDGFKAYRGYSTEKILIHGMEASTLPSDLFQGLHVKRLDMLSFEVNDTAAFGPGITHFLGLEDSLEALFIQASFERKSPISNLKLDHLKALKHVYIEGTHVTEIGNDWFASGPTHLTYLRASRSKIERLGDRAFASLKNLQELYLGVNEFEEISRSMLPSPANHLKNLDLSFNKIRTLPTDMFSGMPALKYVNMVGNLIQTLPEDTLSPVVSQLQSFFISGPLICDQDLKWVCRTSIINKFEQCKKGGLLIDFCRKQSF